MNILRLFVLSFFAFAYLAGLAMPKAYADRNEDRTRTASLNIGGNLLPDEASVPFDPEDSTVARIMVYKSERRLDLLDNRGSLIRSYLISLGQSPVGDKVHEGDNRTPEGKYYISTRNPDSKYHLSLKISYPNKSDLWRARKLGVSPGGDIFIHGMPNGKGWMTWKYNKKKDWTNGCIAVSDKEIREIWRLVPDGTPIHIKP